MSGISGIIQCLLDLPSYKEFSALHHQFLLTCSLLQCFIFRKDFPHNALTVSFTFQLLAFEF